MKNKLNKKQFYTQLKSYTNKYVPIFIGMPIDIGSNMYIFLSEDRTSSMKIDNNFSLQIIDKTKAGTKKYLCRDIYFNLMTERIYSDFQLYKFVNKKIEEVLEVTNE